MIRPAVPLDMPQLVELGRQMHAESPRFSRLRFNEARLAQTLGFLMANENGFLHVAENDDGEIIGGLAAMAAAHWCSDDLIATDLALFVTHEHRGSGHVAVRLVRAYTSWARRRRIELVQLGITAGIDTEAAARLYRWLGLRECGLIFEV